MRTLTRVLSRAVVRAGKRVCKDGGTLNRVSRKGGGGGGGGQRGKLDVEEAREILWCGCLCNSRISTPRGKVS